MAAMKIITLVMPVLACTTASVIKASQQVKATPEDIAMCLSVAGGFLDGPVTKERAIEKATDHCAVDKRIDDKNYVCPHFKEGLKISFEPYDSDQEFTAQDFCEVAEQGSLDIRGAARLPGIGEGPLIEFRLAKTCASMVEATMKPSKELESSKVPDFWYSMCLNQDCAHFLQSRTRWCSVSHPPTHSVNVCNAMRDFAKDEVSVLGSGKMNSEQLCDMYAEFVKEMGENVEAYEHVMHIASEKRVPVPGDPARALQSSQLVNDAASHHIRDNQGAQVKSAASTSAVSSILGLFSVSLLFQSCL